MRSRRTYYIKNSFITQIQSNNKNKSLISMSPKFIFLFNYQCMSDAESTVERKD